MTFTSIFLIFISIDHHLHRHRRRRYRQASSQLNTTSYQSYTTQVYGNEKNNLMIHYNYHQ